MEEDTAIGKDRPARSRRSAGVVSSTPVDPSTEEASLVSGLGTAHGIPPGDQAFQSTEKDQEKEVSESRLDDSGILSLGVDGEITPGNSFSPEVAPLVQPAQTASLEPASGGVYHPADGSSCLSGRTGLQVPPSTMMYEGSTARPPPHPRMFPTLPANTTDDAKLVDRYESTLGLSASGIDRSRLPIGSSKDNFENRVNHTAPQIQTENPTSIIAGELSTRPKISRGGVSNGSGMITAPKTIPHELGLVDQLAAIGQPKQEENLSTPGNETKTINTTNAYQSHEDTEAVKIDSSSCDNGPSLASKTQSTNPEQEGDKPEAENDVDHEVHPVQSLKDILSNIVLEEQVITIKLHRDPPSTKRNQRRGDRSLLSRFKTSSATDARTPGLLAPHSEDQITHISTGDRRERPIMHRAISNIETRSDRNFYHDEPETPSAGPSTSKINNGQAIQNVHHDPSSTSFSSDMRRTTSEGAFCTEDPQPVAGPSRQARRNGPRTNQSSLLTPSPVFPAVAVSDNERTSRLNVVVQRTGRRSAPVFSRRGFGTADFWNSGVTSINKAILKQVFSRPPGASSGGRRSRAADRDKYGRERSLSVGAERRSHGRSKRILGDGNTEQAWGETGRASVPVNWGKTTTTIDGKKKKPGRRKLASYGSMEERRPSRYSLDPDANNVEGSTDIMSSRYSTERETWTDENDEVLAEELFRTGRSAYHLHGFRSQRRAPPRNMAVDPSSNGPGSVEPGSLPRPISVQEHHADTQAVSERTGKERRRTRDQEKRGENESESESSSEDDENSTLLKETKTEIYHRRWYLLFLFSMMALIWNAIWSTWGPIAQSAKQVYNWGDGDIAMFTWLGNLPFLITMFPIAYLMDVKGMRTATVLCCGLMCLGAGLRCIPCDTQTETWLIRLGQLLNGVAGTVPISGPGLLSGLWFPPNQRATATAISTVSGYLGACVSFVLGPLLVKEPSLAPINGSSLLLPHLDAHFNNLLANHTEIEEQKKGIETILYSEFAAAAALFILVVIYFPSKPPLPPSISASVPREEYVAGLKMLVRNKQFWVTAIAYSVPIGVYEVWQVVLDIILDPKVSQQTAGWMDFYATIGGCISGLLISRFADLFTRQMKVFLLVFYFLATASMLWFSLLVAGILPFDVGMVYAAMVVGGVFLDGGAPLFFELVIEVSYPVGEGVTSGCLQMICAGAGVLFLSLVQINSIGKEWMNWLFTACITLAIPLLFFIKTNYTRADIDDVEFEVSSSSSSSSSLSSSEDEEEEEEAKRNKEDTACLDENRRRVVVDVETAQDLDRPVQV